MPPKRTNPFKLVGKPEGSLIDNELPLAPYISPEEIRSRIAHIEQATGDAALGSILYDIANIMHPLKES